MLPGCGCCDCTCCDVTPPAEVDVALTFTDDECTKCNENVNGTYTLAHQGCEWDYLSIGDSYTDVNCRASPDPYPNFWLDGIRVLYQMWCVDGSTLAARARVYLYFKREADAFGEWTSDPIPPCKNNDPERVWVRNTYEYYKEFARSGFDCSTDTVVLDYVTSYCDCMVGAFDGPDVPLYPCQPNIDSLPSWEGCQNAPATLSMVPVP